MGEWRYNLCVWHIRGRLNDDKGTVVDEVKNMANPTVEAPQTIKEVGIHIGYRND